LNLNKISTIIISLSFFLFIGNAFAQERKYKIGTPSITKDGTKMYFTVCDQEINNCNIYLSVYSGLQWFKPVRLLNVYSKVVSSKYPQVFFDSKSQSEYLIFSSNVEGGMGEFDIYYAFIESDGHISEPVNVGEKVNTPDDELSLFYDSSSSYLYFISSREIVIGDLDVFKVKASISEGFVKPENIGHLINFSENEYYFVSIDSADNKNTEDLSSQSLVKNKSDILSDSKDSSILKTKLKEELMISKKSYNNKSHISAKKTPD